MKFKALAIVAAGAFLVSSAFGDKACCAQKAENSGKMDCASYDSLNLSAEQKTQMDTLAAECHKGGCNKETMSKMTAAAKKVLTKEQFSQWQSGHEAPADKKS